MCKSLGFPHYRSPGADIVIIGVVGSTCAFLILVVPGFALFLRFPFDALFGPPPQRIIQRSHSTVTVTEDPPYLFLCIPLVYFYSLLSIVTVTNMAKPKNSEGERLTKNQVARVASLGSLPVSVLCVLVVPFLVAFAQCADRAVNNWKRGIAKLEPRQYEDSALRKVVYQYTFSFRRRQIRTGRAGDGLA